MRMFGSAAVLIAVPGILVHAPILLFNGEGTSPGDVAAFERLLDARQMRFSTRTFERP